MQPARGAGAGGHHAAADLVTERERQFGVGAHAVVEVAQVGVADATAGDRHGYLAGPGRAGIELGSGHGFADGGHHPSLCGGCHSRHFSRASGGGKAIFWYHNTYFSECP